VGEFNCKVWCAIVGNGGSSGSGRAPVAVHGAVLI
jgi:hypothetical protein